MQEELTLLVGGGEAVVVVDCEDQSLVKGLPACGEKERE